MKSWKQVTFHYDELAAPNTRIWGKYFSKTNIASVMSSCDTHKLAHGKLYRIWKKMKSGRTKNNIKWHLLTFFYKICKYLVIVFFFFFFSLVIFITHFNRVTIFFLIVYIIKIKIKINFFKKSARHCNLQFNIYIYIYTRAHYLN